MPFFAGQLLLYSRRTETAAAATETANTEPGWAAAAEAGAVVVAILRVVHFSQEIQIISSIGHER